MSINNILKRWIITIYFLNWFTGNEISRSVSNMTDVLNDVSNFIHKNTADNLDIAEKYIKEYSPYRYYISLGASIVLVVITTFIVLGLICGICGKTPNKYNNDCCNKASGSRFLMWLVNLFFYSINKFNNFISLILMLTINMSEYDSSYCLQCKVIIVLYTDS